MKWNWQIDGWPRFSFDPDALKRLESEFLTASGLMLGVCGHLESQELDELRVELMSDEALKTSEIEGEHLQRASVQSSIRRQFGLNTDQKRVPPAEQGIAELSVQLYRKWSEPLSKDMLCDWHSRLSLGRGDLTDVGCYRSMREPMQIVSGPIGHRKVHFEAPPVSCIEGYMDEFIAWFNRTRAGEVEEIPALTRAGIAHLWFESMHPFEDGNGRIGRFIAEKALSQDLRRPTLIALSRAIEADRKSYYAALEQVNRRLEITDWLVWFAKTALNAQELSIQTVRFLVRKTKLYARIGQLLNKRQSKVLARMFEEGLAGFKGGLSAENYMRIAKTSASTATRDLRDLAAKGALTRTGERKATRYHLKLD